MVSKKQKWEANPELLKINAEQEKQIREVLANYKGNINRLETAIGALIVGQHYGWRVLRMAHSPSTYRAYEQVLGIRFEEACPEKGPLAMRSIGLKAAEKLGAFWDVVMGRQPVPKKGDVE